ncbi:hypothetical protein PLESTF_000327800 [Pleodorina starrii]|nr:hypothetical protein PLESTF_000327800 [Pleodorina starrii]
MVDFAEAALLIQGSAVVFSKKVEYLYNLTYQAIEAVKGRRRPDGQPEGDAGQPAAAARGRGAAAARAGDDDEDDCLDHFWNDEDLLKEMGDLDLTPEEGALPNAGLAVRPPAALLALEDHGPGGAGGTSGGKGDGDSGVYRLQQCIVHCSGALMLDPRDADMYDIQLRFIGPQPRQDKGLDQLIDAHRMEIATQPFPQPATQAHAPGPVGQQPTQDNGAAPMDQDPGQPQDFDDDDGGGGGYGGGGDWPSDDEGAPAGTEPKAAEGAASAGAADGVATTESADGRPQRRRAAGSEGGSASVGGGQQADGEAAEEEEEVFDPYKPLDPTANSRLADRPLVVRRPRKAVRSSAKAAGAGAAHGGSAAAAGGLMLAEFGYCLAFLRAGHGAKEEEEQGEGHAATQKARRDRVARARDAPAPVLDARDAAAAVAADEAAIAEPADDPAEPLAEQMPYGFDDDDGSGGYGGGGGGGSDLDDGSGPAAAGRHCFGGDGDAWHNPPGGVDGAEWPGNRELFPGMVPPMGGLGGADDPRVADGEEPSYEELCRAHMESMLMAAAAREVQSDLARRVSGWRQRIDPVLKAEESRPQFDIQEYGELILSRLSGLQITDGSQQGEAPQAQLAAAVEGGGRAGPRARIQFSRVAVQLKTFEVSRMFSAMLQLINNRRA